MTGPSTGGPVDLVVRDAVIVTVDAERRILEGDVVVDDGRIVGLGGHFDGTSRDVVDGRRGAVIPGLVNAHMHECMERGIFEDLPFRRWLDDFAMPKDRAYRPRHQRAAALLCQLEMIRGGTTTFVDIFRYPDEAATVTLASGLRAVISPQIIDHPSGVGESLDDTADFVRRWHGAADRVSAWFGPHALYSCEPATFRRIAALAAELGTGVHTHLAESRDEIDTVAALHGRTPAAVLGELLDGAPRVLVAHAVHLDDPDIDLIATRGWGVAHCPTSNMKLANGTAPVPRMLAAGVTVGLGTDSVMTNNTLDMFEEMRQAALVQKLASGDASVMTCDEVLAMATIGSATALGMGAEIGSLEIGKVADLVVVDLDRPHLWPLLDGGLNVVAQLVYAAGAADVRTTVVGGQVLMDGGIVRTLDTEAIGSLVHEEAHHLLRSAGVLGG